MKALGCLLQHYNCREYRERERKENTTIQLLLLSTFNANLKTYHKLNKQV